jgi:probable FeS assembly SUF system protein SufT
MTSDWSPITLSRDCRATTVPAGEVVELCAGGEVEVVQHLGRSITVRTQMGSLLRIDDADADALGLEAVAAVADDDPPGEFSIDQVLAALSGVFDPEIPVDIVELGLVYRCEEIVGASGSRRIEIDMSMTAPGCGMGDVLRDDAARAARAVPGVDEVDVTLVWDPPWTVQRMSETARLRLGML